MRGTWLQQTCIATFAAIVPYTAALPQVIVHNVYRPPETVQRIPVPLKPDQHRIQLLIISGRNSYEHDWTGVNNVLRRQFEETGRFQVHVIEDFDSATAATLKPYDVVLLNYLGRWMYDDKVEHRWSPQAEAALFDFVRSGHGIVIYHASFGMGAPSWPEFELMAGGTLRGNEHSRRSPPNGFMVHVVDKNDPITKGMRSYFWTLDDDMYAGLHWDPRAKVHVLATGHDSSASYAPELAGPKYPAYAYTPDKLHAMQGMDQDQPLVWTLNYGRGRVFAITLGHGPDTLLWPGVHTLMDRGAEWAATGKVTLPVEDGAEDFPIQTKP
jgi:type 1 glutamine amidotransferase